MRNLFIFGDSFLAPYTPNELARFNWKREYVSAEDGDKVRNSVKDLNYWLKEYRERNSYRLINTAVSGTSNDYIFEQFLRFSRYFSYGDYVVLLVTKLGRTRLVNRFYNTDKKMRKQDKYLDVVFPLDDNANAAIKQQTYFTPDEIEKLALESSSRQHELKIQRYLRGIQNLCFISKVNLLTITIDEKMRGLVNEPHFFQDIPRIQEKFSYIDDRHPTYEGNHLIASRILKYFNIKNKL